MKVLSELSLPLEGLEYVGHRYILILGAHRVEIVVTAEGIIYIEKRYGDGPGLSHKETSLVMDWMQHAMGVIRFHW